MTGSRFLCAEFRALPGRADEVAALVTGYADEVRVEEGNRRFDAHRRRDDPDAFFVYEEYASDAAFAAHLAAPYGAVFNERLAPLVEGGGSTLTELRAVSV